MCCEGLPRKRAPPQPLYESDITMAMALLSLRWIPIMRMQWMTLPSFPVLLRCAILWMKLACACRLVVVPCAVLWQFPPQPLKPSG